MRTAEGQEPHGSALAAHLNQLHHPPSRADSQGARPQTRLQAHLPGATLGVRTRGEPSGQKTEAPGRERGWDSHLTKAGIASGSAPKGRSAVPAAGSCQVGRRPRESPDRSGQGASLPAPSAPADRPRPRSGQAVRVSGWRAAARQPGAGVPPAVPPSLLPSPKHHRHQMAKRRSPRRERCAAAGGTGSAPPQPRRAPGARPGPRRPPRPSPARARAAVGAGPEPGRACALRPPSR